MNATARNRRPLPIPKLRRLVPRKGRPDSQLQVALPRPAHECYQLFCDVARFPEWLKIMRSTTTLARDPLGRPAVVAFLARLIRGSVGYTCDFRYHPRKRGVEWATRPGLSLSVRGSASFKALSARSCLMTYSLEIDWPGGALPGWSEAEFNDHAPSATLSAFRDFAIRHLADPKRS